MTLPEEAKQLINRVREIEVATGLPAHEVDDPEYSSVRDFFMSIALAVSGQTKADDYLCIEIAGYLGMISAHEELKSSEEISKLMQSKIEPYPYRHQLLNWFVGNLGADRYCTMALQTRHVEGRDILDVLALGNILWKEAVLSATIAELEKVIRKNP